MADAADIVIAGGGPVGSALALALSGSGLHVVALEARTAASNDARPLALSHGSRLILERLGVWDTLAGAATPIRLVHVSQRGGFGRVTLDAAEAAVPALGYVVDYAALARALENAARASGADCRSGARVESWQDGHPAQLHYRHSGALRELSARLLVIADGGAAPDVDALDYRQSAVTARVVSERPHKNVAYERFTRDGPLALLPDGEGWALVWTTTPDRASELCACDAERFLAALQEAFGGRAGRFIDAGPRASHALWRRRAPPQPGHALLIGNAAQTLHPVAGQGFNLGLRDAWELAGQIAAQPQALGTSAWLRAYLDRRNLDRGGGLAFTHGLVTLFSNDLPLLGLARGTGLALLGCVPPLKDFVARRMMFGARG